jgi:hypothetical protein
MADERYISIMPIINSVLSSFTNGRPTPPKRPILIHRLKPYCLLSVGNYSSVVTESKLKRICKAARVDTVTT